MAGLVWIKFKKSGITKEISSKIANNKDYQRDPDRGFTIIGEPQELNPEPQKKIETKSEVKEVVVENEDLAAKVETVTIDEVSKAEPAAVKETVEQTVARLHKEKNTEVEIKAATGINILTIRKIIKNIK